MLKWQQTTGSTGNIGGGCELEITVLCAGDICKLQNQHSRLTTQEHGKNVRPGFNAIV
jgi:hypothetical protein